MAKNIETTDVSQIWESLGTFWAKFPEKNLITEIWRGYKEISDELMRRKAQVELSKFLEYLSPVMEYNDTSHEIIFSGSDKNTITSSGLHAYQIEAPAKSIPTLSGIETGQILTEDVDYEIFQHKYIRFLNEPTYDAENTDIDNRVTLYASKEYRHNPVLWYIHASGISMPISSLDNEAYLPYTNIESAGIERVKQIASHYKYLVWGLSEMKRRPPTIANLVIAFGMSRGAAFTYRPGTVDSIVDRTVTVSVSGLSNTYDTYIIPSGYTISVSGGQILSRFQLLMSGINFYDHVNNYSYITSLPGVGPLNYTSKVAFTYPSNFDDLDFDSSYHTEYVQNLLPAGLTYLSSVE